MFVNNLFVDMKKSTQELYALINFGELRKKLGHITEKNSQKLNELIYSGRTQVRVRGKTWRIKTPICRALRRLNNLDGNKTVITTILKYIKFYGFIINFTCISIKIAFENINIFVFYGVVNT